MITASELEGVGVDDLPPAGIVAVVDVVVGPEGLDDEGVDAVDHRGAVVLVRMVLLDPVNLRGGPHLAQREARPVVEFVRRHSPGLELLLHPGQHLSIAQVLPHDDVADEAALGVSQDEARPHHREADRSDLVRTDPAAHDRVAHGVVAVVHDRLR